MSNSDWVEVSELTEDKGNSRYTYQKKEFSGHVRFLCTYFPNKNGKYGYCGEGGSTSEARHRAETMYAAERAEISEIAERAARREVS